MFYALCLQFSSIKEHGTRVIIYNLWEDDQGDLELDFDADINVSLNSKTMSHVLVNQQTMVSNDIWEVGYSTQRW